MAILMDEARWWYPGRKWCHLISDVSYEELIEFADGTTEFLDLPFLFVFLSVMFWYSWQLSLIAVATVTLLAVLGVDPFDEHWSAGSGGGEARLHDAVDALVATLLEQRQAARAAKDFGAADAIRDTIKAAGIAQH